MGGHTGWLTVIAAVILTGCVGNQGALSQGPPPTRTSAAVAPQETPSIKPAAMPAGDGLAMLWPTTSTQIINPQGWATERIRHGFVDVSGRLVVPPRYEAYEFCRNAAGRATLVLGSSAQQQTDILDLSGRLIGTVPGRFAACVGDTHVTFSTDSSELGPADVGVGLAELPGGKVVIPVRKGRVVTMLDRRTVNVHQRKGEYFLDLATGRRTSHAGFVSALGEPLSSEEKVARIPASTEPYDPTAETEEAPLGYLDRSGNWALTPALTSAGPFRDGFAVVSQGETQYFVDEAFDRHGREWSSIDSLDGGYLVTAHSRGTDLTGVLGKDLRVMVSPTDAEISCGEDVCGIHPTTGPAQLLLISTARLIDTPDGFSHVMGGDWLSDAKGELPATRLLNRDAGATLTLQRPAFCELAGRWIRCQPAEKGAPPFVLRSDGGATGFREVTPVGGEQEGSDSGYAWVIAGTFQGFVDGNGTWLYRESRYSELED